MPRSRFSLSLVLVALVAPAGNLTAQTTTNAISEDHFERWIRPMLVDTCLECHGPNQQEGGLRLDQQDALLTGGDSGPAIVPGNPQESLLWQAIRRDGDLQMPPDDPLEPGQIQAVEVWIKAGAPWPAGPTPGQNGLTDQHWAFQPPQRATLPDPLTQAAELQPQRRLDLLIAQQWLKHELPPADKADPSTRLRRVAYTLTGLPPTARDRLAWTNDSRPDAWSRQVDRLLGSPRFGEHWARHWMDVSRYADNKGYVFFEQQKFPWAYTYRDYLIRAFNESIAYDRFLLEQLAADQLDDLPDESDLAALGFLTTGGHFINNTHDILDDRIDVISRGLMGLTLSCARCHDHKYDPTTTQDYYAWYGILNSCYEPIVPPPLDSNQAQGLSEYNQELEKRQSELTEFVEAKFAGLIQSARTRVDEYLAAVHHRRTHPSTEDFMLIADPDDVNPSMITRWEHYLESTATEDHPVWGPWAIAHTLGEDHFPDDWDWTSQSADRPWSSLLVERLIETPPLNVAELAKVYGELFREAEAAWQMHLTEHPQATGLDDERESFRLELYAQGTPADLSVQLDWGFLSLFPDRATQNEYKQKLGAVEQWLTEPPEAPARAMVLLDRDRPTNAHVFVRGNPHQLGAEVPRRFIEFMSPAGQTFQQGSGRLELAQQIIAPDNPLTDRVWVNRVWMHVMGQSLVDSPGDFGLRTSKPRLNELLDDLVRDFRSRDRDTKRLVRELVTSTTYQLSSTATPDALRLDPANQFYSRAVRQRLSFEAMRDSMLAAAGRLSNRIGGPSEDLLSKVGTRRSVYNFINRLDVAPLLTTFDVPNPAATSPSRTRTTIPTQALYWLNQPQVIELADELIKRPDLQELAPLQRIDRVIEILWSRPATKAEKEWSAQFLGIAPSDSTTAEPIDHDRWVRWTHALMMANETVFID